MSLLNLLTNISNDDLDKVRDRVLEIPSVRIDSTAFSLQGEVIPNTSAIYCNNEDRLRVLNILSPETWPLDVLT